MMIDARLAILLTYFMQLCAAAWSAMIVVMLFVAAGHDLGGGVFTTLFVVTQGICLGMSVDVFMTAAKRREVIRRMLR